MDKAILIPIIIWAVLTVITVLKNTVSPAARICAAIALVVFGFIFKDDILALIHMKEIPYMALVKSTVEYLFISLAVVWPATLIYAQHMTDTDSSSVILKLAVFSAIICTGFLYFN